MSSFFLKFCQSFDWLVTGLGVAQFCQYNHTHDKQIGLQFCGCLIFLNTLVITDQIGHHKVLLPLLIEKISDEKSFQFSCW